MEYIEALLHQFFRPGSFLIMMAVVIGTFFIKKTVSVLQPKWRPKRTQVKHEDSKVIAHVNVYCSRWAEWWNEVGLSMIPVVIGCCFAFSKSEFLYGEVNNSTLTRFLWTGSLGWLSAFFYQIIRKLILQKTGVTLPENAESTEISSGE